jgi:predicted GH43/DUF377 family glycosyl hydrolase
MIKVKKHGVILRPTARDFENKSVFNPGVFQDGENIHIIYRGLNERFISSLGYAKLKGPLKVVERWKEPFLAPRHKYESHGVEDARIVKIKDAFYMTYVVHDGKNALIAYSYGKDLFHLKRGGIISPQMSYDAVGRLFKYSKLKDDYYFFKSYYKDMVARDVLLWDKDGILFPEKIKRKFALIHRILPDIQVIYFNKFSRLKDVDYWKEYIKKLSKNVILEGGHGFEARNVGGGCPPIKTDLGWLLIYHGVEPMNKGRIYHAGAALLDLKDPTKTIAHLPYPLFSPTKKWEKEGHVHNVVFPTGTAIFGSKLYIYYGASDKYVAVASVSLKGLLRELMRHRVRK